MHMNPPRKLNVVVTGGSSGIGAAIVQAFASAGHRVLYSYFSHPPPLAQTSSSANSVPNVSAHFLDQGDPHSIQAFAQHVRSWLTASHGKLDVLVNNAALGSATVKSYLSSSTSDQIRQLASSPSPSFSSHPHPTGLLVDPKAAGPSTVAEDVALMQVNALGPLWVTQALLPLMTHSPSPRTTGSSSWRSSVIFLGSVGGGTAVFPEYLPADLMSKAAVGYLTRHLAAAHAHSPIDVLCVSPGATRTSMFEASTLNAMPPDEKRRFLAAMPKGSLIEPDEVAQCVLAIATSGWARILHGACIDASLGLGVRPGLQTEFPAAASSENPAVGSSGLKSQDGQRAEFLADPVASSPAVNRPTFSPPSVPAAPSNDSVAVAMRQLAVTLLKPRL